MGNEFGELRLKADGGYCYLLGECYGILSKASGYRGRKMRKCEK